MVNIKKLKNMIYISDLHHYDYSKMENMSASMIIQLCHNNSLSYNTMTKENFIHLMSLWNNLINKLTPLILLYQDDKDWFDVKPFDTQEAMEQFVADHTQK